VRRGDQDGHLGESLRQLLDPIGAAYLTAGGPYLVGKRTLPEAQQAAAVCQQISHALLWDQSTHISDAVTSRTNVEEDIFHAQGDNLEASEVPARSDQVGRSRAAGVDGSHPPEDGSLHARDRRRKVLV
jgi:hypothetical protein